MFFFLLAITSEVSGQITSSGIKAYSCWIGLISSCKPEMNFKVYLSVSTNREICCFPPFFFSRAEIRFDTQRNIWSRQMRGKTEKLELELTRRHAGRHGAHQSQPRAGVSGWTHQSVWILAYTECKTPQLRRAVGSNLRYWQWNKYRGTNQRKSSVYPI